MLGKEIPIKEEHHVAIKALGNDITKARTGYHIAVQQLHEAEKSLWQTMHELYPEIKYFNASLNREKMVIILKSREDRNNF